MNKVYITELLNSTLATASLIGFLVVLFWLFLLFYIKQTQKKLPTILFFVGMYAYPIACITALFSIVMTLFYSEYLLFVPCWLCWWQRILSYPLFFMSIFAWYKKEIHFFDYTIVLSSVGLVVALYHQYLQMGYSPFIPCSALPGAADCAKPVFIEYGFITFPFMSVVLFMFFIALSLTAKRVFQKEI